MLIRVAAAYVLVRCYTKFEMKGRKKLRSFCSLFMISLFAIAADFLW